MMADNTVQLRKLLHTRYKICYMETDKCANSLDILILKMILLLEPQASVVVRFLFILQSVALSDPYQSHGFNCNFGVNFPIVLTYHLTLLNCRKFQEVFRSFVCMLVHDMVLTVPYFLKMDSTFQVFHHYIQSPATKYFITLHFL